jgi:pimeloyl-ACP methyl ester carboxylesterase
MTTTTAPAATQAGTQFVTSADGTRIAYEVHGSGPALVFVDGAMCQRTMGPSAGLAEALAPHFTVHVYDRRGRGESDAGATPWSVDRELDDLAAILDVAGGSAHVLALSSGAALALEAADRGLPITRLAVYEAPFIVDDSRAPHPADAPARVQGLVDRGARGEAVKTFMRMVGLPAPFIGVMRVLPAWKKMTGIAHTLPYDLAIVNPHQQGTPLPAGRYAGVGVPTLVIAGGKSPRYMRNAQAAIADAVPDGRLVTLPGQTHMVKAKVTGPVVTRFFVGEEAR